MAGIGIHDFGIFLVSCIVLNITPGPDTFYILGRGMAQGRAAGVASALGIGSGALVHTMAAAFGVSALLATSASAFFVVKMLGAVYLIYMGIKMLLTKVAPPSHGETEDVGDDNGSRSGGNGLRGTGFWATYRQGLLTNVLNPKVALFFLAFLPQFIDAQSPSKFVSFLILGLTFVTTGTLWCLGLAWFAGALGGKLRGQSGSGFATWLNRAAGALFVALGVRLAVSR